MTHTRRLKTMKSIKPSSVKLTDITEEAVDDMETI